MEFISTQAIQQLDKRQGGYFFLKIDAETVESLPKKKNTRLICTIDDTITWQCGLNHLGDGNFFIIIATRFVKSLNKKIGDEVRFLLKEDPNPLGVDIPEVLEVLLEQDEELKAKFNQLTDGKKRSIIHGIIKLKDIDKQIETAQKLILNPPQPHKKAK